MFVFIDLATFKISTEFAASERLLYLCIAMVRRLLLSCLGMKTSLPEALFLDRDGTLIKWVDYLHDPSEVVLEPGIARALLKTKKAGCRLFLHTNQSGVGRGYFSMSAVHAVNDEMFRQMGIQRDFFDEICIAPDDPSSLDDQSYRKPSPRFELEMIEKYGLEKTACYMIGDSSSDIEAGVNAGIGCVGLRGNKSDDPFRETGAEVFESVAQFVDSVIV